MIEKKMVVYNFPYRSSGVIPEGLIGNMVLKMANKQYYVYMMASKRDGMLYVGVMSDPDGFTNKYHIHNLVYFEVTEDITSAITREKQLKKWNRSWKIALIEKNNPEWRDLYYDLIK